MVTTMGSGFMNAFGANVKDTKFNLYKGITFSKSINLQEKVPGAKYLNSYSNNNQLCYIDASYNKDKKEIESYYRAVDKNGHVTKSTLINNVSGSALYLRAPWYVFNTAQSPDHSKILNIALFNNKNSTGNYQLSYYGESAVVFKPNSMKLGVVDENGDLFFKKEIIIDASADCDKISIEDFNINNKGDVFLLIKQYIKGKKEKKSGDANYKLYIYTITNKGTSSKKHAIDTKDYFCKSPNLVVSNSGNVYCAGFLSEQVSGKFVGFFTQKLGTDSDEAQFHINKISSEDITRNNSVYKYKDDEISNNFVINYISEVGESVHISAEYFAIVSRTRKDGGIEITYYRNDILYFELDKALNLKQIHLIAKYQRGHSDTYFGYKLIIHNDQPYFIFNDHKQNVDKDESDKLRGATTTFKNMTAVIVYHDGSSWVRDQIFGKKDIDENILMSYAVRQVDNNTVFLPFKRKGNYVIGKLTFTK
ncbi:MAG: hypothetical protein M9887_09010 [Chitinophagales bacterium]|nr:hypothetical protein [Chitinophagales bacterium]